MSPPLFKPRHIFFAGVLLLLVGWGVNHFLGLTGILQLQTGKVNSLVTRTTDSPVEQVGPSGLGYKITLDSMYVHPHTPAYELKLWKRDSTSANPHRPAAGASKTLVNVFPLEPMVIQKVEGTDFRFRLKAFYPDFEFSYEYPLHRDTLKPIAPGITLRLKTIEGEPIVTLLRDKPGANRLNDIVSLGASLDFYWELTEDSVKALIKQPKLSENKIVFSGADQMVYFLLDGIWTEQPLQENNFYSLSDEDSTGFTILFCFPDAAYLKAVPSTKGSEIHNPVAHVEIWKTGGSAKDAFVYPETISSKGGDFLIPSTDYKIGMDIIHQESVKYCDCHLTIQTDSADVARSFFISAGKALRYRGYVFTPMECYSKSPGIVMMQVSRAPGRILIIAGICIGLMALFLLVFNAKRDPK